METFKHEYNLDVVNDLPTGIYDAVILSVAHDEFLSLDESGYCRKIVDYVRNKESDHNFLSIEKP